MRKIVKLMIFNLALVIIFILCFSNKGIGLGFDLGLVGAFKFALSISLTFFGISIFGFVNYKILTTPTKVMYKIDKLETIEDCIMALNQCTKTDPSFKNEISKAIEQLKTLNRRKDSLTELLQHNDILKDFNFLNKISNDAEIYVFSNVKRIINRLIAFDNQEYLSNQETYDISSHKNYIDNALENNKNILDEYSKLLIDVSNICDEGQPDIDEIRNMTEKLNSALLSMDGFKIV